MSLIGTNVAQSVAGLTQAERVAARDTDRKAVSKAQRTRAVEDAVELDHSQADDAVRSLKDNTGEEAAEDRRGKTRQQATKSEPKHLDIQG